MNEEILKSHIFLNAWLHLLQYLCEALIRQHALLNSIATAISQFLISNFTNHDDIRSWRNIARKLAAKRHVNFWIHLRLWNAQ